MQKMGKTLYNTYFVSTIGVKFPMDLAIVIPTYNEKTNVDNIIKELTTLYKSAHLFIVDDNSPDGTGQVVAKWAKKNKKVHLIARKAKSGIGRSYLHGFAEVLKRNPQYIVQMDADFSHDPQVIKQMLREIKNADVVLGSRYIQGISVINWPLRRILLSWFANLYVRLLTRMPILDATGGFKCFTREALTTLRLDKIKSDGYCFQVEVNYLLYKFGCKIKEIPIVFTDRHEGTSKMSKAIILEALVKVLFMPFKNIKSYQK